MTKRGPLERLLRPRNIAVAGGSWAGSVLQQCQLMGFSGPLWALHPQREEIHGVRCYRSVADLPEAPDATFIGVNRHLTVEIVAQLAQRDAGGAVCFASGFSEAAAESVDGFELQQQLVDAADEMPILGPNCYGLINYLDGALLWPDMHGGKRVSSGVALITQSSNIAINLTMQTRGLPIAYVLTAGNQAQTGLAQMAEALLQDSRVTALGLYIEGFGDIRALEQLAATARVLGKGVVVIKAGKSQHARDAMVSHTSSISGNDSAAQAFIKRLGFASVDSLPSLLETLKLLHVHGPLAGNQITSMSCSGGEAGLMADSLGDRDLAYLELDEVRQQSLRDALGPMVAIANPLDYHTYIWGDKAALTQAYGAMLAADADFNFLLMDLPREDRCDGSSWMIAVDAFVDASRVTGAAAALLVSLPENASEGLIEDLIQRGVIVCLGIPEALDAVEATARIGVALGRARSLPVLLADDSDQVGVEPLCGDDAGLRQSLAAAGIEFPATHFATDLGELRELAPQLNYPVVLKGTGVEHKTEVGAVHLNLANTEMLLAAAESMQAVCNGYLVEDQIDSAVAEVLVGIVRDSVCGFQLTIAAGGVLTELLSDAVNLLLPVSRDEITEALNKLKIAPLLHGYRGAAAANVDALADTIDSLCHWVSSHAISIDEIELNPILCLPERCVAVDALLKPRVDHD